MSRFPLPRPLKEWWNNRRLKRLPSTSLQELVEWARRRDEVARPARDEIMRRFWRPLVGILKANGLSESDIEAKGRTLVEEALGGSTSLPTMYSLRLWMLLTNADPLDARSRHGWDFFLVQFIHELGDTKAQTILSVLFSLTPANRMAAEAGFRDADDFVAAAKRAACALKRHLVEDISDDELNERTRGYWNRRYANAELRHVC